MSYGTYTDSRPSAPNPAPQTTAQFSKVEAFIQSRIKALIEEGWSWKAIAGALDLTVEQTQWYAGYR